MLAPGRGVRGRGVAGLPTTTVSGATSRVTTAPAPTSAWAPTRIPPRITAPDPTRAPSSNRGGVSGADPPPTCQSRPLSLIVRTPAPRNTPSASTVSEVMCDPGEQRTRVPIRAARSMVMVCPSTVCAPTRTWLRTTVWWPIMTRSPR